MALILESAISPALLSELERSYDFGDRRTVSDFLQRHSSIGPLLREARDELSSRFGAAVRLSLAVIQDPDEPDSGTLYAFVKVAGDADRALNRLADFNDEWWRVTSGSEPIPLHFALEYV